MRYRKRLAWLKAGGLPLTLAAVMAGTAARAQDVPEVVTPLKVEADRNGVNLLTGRISMDIPVLQVPGAPNLRFDRVQNSAPYVDGTTEGSGDTATGNYTVQTGTGGAEAFRCVSPSGDCTSVTGTGSTFTPGVHNFRQAGTGAFYRFTEESFDVDGPPRGFLRYYAKSITYPDGEEISFLYDTGVLGAFNQVQHRPRQIISSRGYVISIAYHADTVEAPGWTSPRQATLYSTAAPGTPLQQLNYSGGTITDLGGREYLCSGCANVVGRPVEVWSGSLQLPGEGAPSLQVTAVPGLDLVGSVVRDGVQWNYAYENVQPLSNGSGYRFSRVTVTGPNDYRHVYQIGQGESRNLTIGSVTDSLARTTRYHYESYRPVRAILPELNELGAGYDAYGNQVVQSQRAKPGTPPAELPGGQTEIAEQAHYPADFVPNSCDISCWRPDWSRDARGRQADYAHNDDGQLTEQLDPADANGVRRRTSILYATVATPTGPISRRSEVRICPDAGASCGGNAPIVTRYEYFGKTNLPTLERRVDSASGQTLDTVYAYDAAGRLTTTDGPLSGTGDATYNRYDVHGRRTWEIGAVGGNGLRNATRTTYRDSDDKVTSVETGTVPDPNSTTLTVTDRVDTVYDARRNPGRETVSAGGTAYTLVQRTFDQSNRLECEARRMNRAAFASLPASACTLGTPGTQGPDRITRNSWDREGQLLQEQRAYGVTTANGFPATLQQNYATYTYSLNGRRTSVTDANNNRAEMSWDGFDRQRRWIFPDAATGQANPNDYEEYGYDAAGNRTSLRKRDGSTLTYQYDNLNRLILKTVPERAGLAATHTRDVHYGYDLRNQQLFARFDSAAGEGVTNVYDAFGRLASSTANMDGISRALAYQWDAGSRRTRITFPSPDSAAFNASYHPSGQANALTDPAGSAIVAYSYNPAGRLNAHGRPGATSGFQYDPLGRLNSLSHYIGAPLDVLWTFAHNPASQIVTRTRSNDAYVHSLPVNGTRNYSVNRLNQYSAVAGVTHSYDANGNLTSDGASTFVYDVENRLVSASGARNATLRYDPLGRLHEVAGGSGTRRFLHDGDALVAEYDTTGAMTDRYVHGSGAGDDPLLWYQGTSTAASNRRNLLADHQGSIVAIGDNGGTRLFVNAYDAWGVPNAANHGRFQYTGQIWLPELRLYHYKARAYSPDRGRFYQTDPVGYDDQVNLYAYVGNDPINQVDPSGKCFGPLIIPCGIAAADLIGPGLAIIVGVPIFMSGPPLPPRQDIPASDRNVGRNDNGGPPLERRPVAATDQRDREQAARSLERGAERKLANAAEHDRRATEFARNPTVRPGMEDRNPAEIANQQRDRIAHLRQEAAEFRRQAAADLARANRLREERE